VPKFSARILDIRCNFHETLEFNAFADILSGRQYFIFADVLSGRQYFIFADILGGRQYFMIMLDFVAANICMYFF
jgi:hypothetical protein